jgi:hypothetical protein
MFLSRMYSCILAFFIMTLIIMPKSVFAGHIVAWGDDTYGQRSLVPAGETFVDVADSNYVCVALTYGGNLVAWGDWPYDYGQNDVPTEGSYVAIAAGGYHGLALASDGSIATWGRDDYGLGDVPAGNDFQAISAGWLHSLALKNDGSLVAWGVTHQQPVPSGNDYVAISAGAYHYLALKADGSVVVVSWGVASGIPTGNNVAISAQGMSSLALKDDGSVVARGHTSCVDSSSFQDIQTIAAGNYSSLGLRNDGTLVACGSLSIGLPSGNDFRSIAAGGYTGLAIEGDVPIVLVNVDIKPGSYPNVINLGSQGLIPVAILSSSVFDATTADPDSVELAGSSVAVRGRSNKFMAHQEDVNGDGLTDLVVQVATENLDPEQIQDGLGVITGIAGSFFFEGQDEIVIVPPE